MKKLIYTLVLVFALMVSVDTVYAAGNKDKAKTELTAAQQVELKRITDRVEEIKSMDKSDLSKDERKALKKELKELKQQARAMGGGVYLSVGAIIIIILVLILIL